jgi:glycosyltransferase involved in cell wall biosynthesis
MAIAVIFANYGPYHIARLGAASHLSQAYSQSVIGIELARQEKEYPWHTTVNALPFKLYSVTTEQPLEEISSPTLCIQLWQLLNQLAPDAVAIAGYSRPPMLTALLWCRQRGKPAILMSDSTEYDFTRNPLKEIVKRSIVKRFDAALVGGKPHTRYLIKLGMVPEAIFPGYDVVGNDVFHPDKTHSLAPPLNTPYFLSINRFIPKKNLSFLISAYAQYREIAGNSTWDLVLCGDGELRSDIERQIQELNLQIRTHLPGFLQQNDLLPYFAHARCFIHASIQEQWGLVVNEAMAAGLPVLVSDRCGCFEDLVIDGVNGFGFDPENQEQLTNLMLKMSSGEVDLDAMGQAALDHIQKYSPDYFAQGLKQAIDYAFKQRS